MRQHAAHGAGAGLAHRCRGFVEDPGGRQPLLDLIDRAAHLLARPLDVLLDAFGF
jgi:hypothetical protein